MGNPTKVKIVKNKLAPPFRITMFDIMFGEGISKTGEMVDLGVDNDIIQKSGSWYAYEGTKIAQGREAAKRFLMDNPELMEKIEQQIKSKYLPELIDPVEEEVKKEEEVEIVAES